MRFTTVYMPYINTEGRANELVEQLQQVAERDGARPIVFATMPDAQIRHLLRGANCFYVELFDNFVNPLEEELGVQASGKRGLTHGYQNGGSYEHRMHTINFAMNNDDGARLDKYNQAQVILVGVSRSGKTPTCLYLAIHFDIKAANYPLTEEDFENGRMPQALLDNRDKLIALVIDPLRLHRIREERRPGSRYASLARCRIETRQAEQIFKQLRLPMLDTTSHSIEEVSSTIVKSI